MTNRFWLRVATGILALGAGLAGPACATPVATATFADIDAALSASDGDQALRLSDVALNTFGLDNADRARLMMDRGLGRNLQGDHEGALADLIQAINAHSLTMGEQARAYLERGLVLDSMNRLNEAIGDYGAALRLNPRSAPALNDRANAYRRQNRLEDAQRDYLASLAADNPAPEYPYYGLGQIAEQHGKLTEAKGFYGRAVQANPGYQPAADRLAALGVMPANSPIVLKPPPGTITLGSAPIVLRPPPPASAVKAWQPAPAIKVAAASSGAVTDGPGLRPALDDTGGQEAQLGAWRSEGEAAAGWHKALALAGGALTGLSPHIAAADLLGLGRYYRLRVRVADSKQFCAVLTARGVDCFPVRD